MYKPLDMFLKQTDELKELIAKYPDYPIVVLVDSEVVADDYGWWYAPEIRFGIGEILDCEQDVDDEKTYIDRDEFEDDLRDKLSWDEIYDKIGEQPDEYNYTYCIILSTGVKVNISQDKYEEINKIIDSKQFLMTEIDNNLKNKSEIN